MAMTGSPDASMPGYFSIEIDEMKQTLRITIEDTWTPAIAHAYISAYNISATYCRRAFGRLKMITDASRMPIQPQDVTAIVSAGQGNEDGDRFAVVLDTTLAKVSTRRHLQALPPTIQWEVFLSANAAETWLQAT